MKTIIISVAVLFFTNGAIFASASTDTFIERVRQDGNGDVLVYLEDNLNTVETGHSNCTYDDRLLIPAGHSYRDEFLSIAMLAYTSGTGVTVHTHASCSGSNQQMGSSSGDYFRLGQ